MGCRGICCKYDGRGEYRGGGPHMYEKGFSRCTLCSVSLKWEGLFCPCCGYRLRKTARNRRHRDRKNHWRAD